MNPFKTDWVGRILLVFSLICFAIAVWLIVTGN